MSGDKAILMATYFHLFNRNLEKAEILIQGLGSQTRSTLACHGWLEIYGETL
jgi:hypothetical protein